MSYFGDRIRQIRIGKKMSLEQLSRKSGVNRTYISKIECGKIKNPYISTLEKIARGLSVDPIELYPPYNISDRAGLIRHNNNLHLTDHNFIEEISPLIKDLHKLYDTNRDRFNKVIHITEKVIELFCFCLIIAIG